MSLVKARSIVWNVSLFIATCLAAFPFLCRGWVAFTRSISLHDMSYLIRIRSLGVEDVGIIGLFAITALSLSTPTFHRLSASWRCAYAVYGVVAAICIIVIDIIDLVDLGWTYTRFQYLFAYGVVAYPIVRYRMGYIGIILQYFKGVTARPEPGSVSH